MSGRQVLEREYGLGVVRVEDRTTETGRGRGRGRLLWQACTRETRLMIKDENTKENVVCHVPGLQLLRWLFGGRLNVHDGQEVETLTPHFLQLARLDRAVALNANVVVDVVPADGFGVLLVQIARRQVVRLRVGHLEF